MECRKDTRALDLKGVVRGHPLSGAAPCLLEGYKAPAKVWIRYSIKSHGDIVAHPFHLKYFGRDSYCWLKLQRAEDNRGTAHIAEAVK